MQAVVHFAPSSLLPLTPSKGLAQPLRSISVTRASLCPPLKATGVASDSSTVDYSSTTSVFPAEACETIGGEACDAEMYPEVKLEPEVKSNKPKTASEMFEREYLEYNQPKTVFPGEACDDLGGEFCEPEYQSGVY